MILDFKCENKSCKNYDNIVERNIPHADIENQICDCCGENLRRVWNTTTVGVRTSDGYKR